MPLKELHVAVPHVQSMVLSEDPSTFVQGSPLEQVLVEAVQKKPEAAVHPVPPHKQVAVFDVAPLVCVQSVAAMHRQKSELLVHDAVEVDFVLYFRLLPCQKHPGGHNEYEYSSATTSSRPMLVAAASHNALSKIGFRLLSDTHLLLPASLV